MKHIKHKNKLYILRSSVVMKDLDSLVDYRAALYPDTRFLPGELTVIGSDLVLEITKSPVTQLFTLYIYRNVPQAS